MKSYIVSCEHGGNEVPREFAELFAGHEETLESHRGWDPGAREIAEYLGRELPALVFCAGITRLLIEFNRSLHHSQLFSSFSKDMDEERKTIALGLYHKYRNGVIEKISELRRQGREVVHLSIHTFTPVLDGEERHADIGALFDPQRPEEKEFSEKLIANLRLALPGYIVRDNYPYLGTDDGFTTYLRKAFPEKYIGLELEINQKHLETPEMDIIKKRVASALQGL